MNAIESGLAQALALLGAGRAAEAEALGAQLLAQAPAHPALLQLQAALALARGDGAAALRAAQASPALRPDHPPTRQLAQRAQAALWYERGRAERAAGAQAGARAAFEAALRLAPGLEPAWFALALACQDLGDLGAAQAALEQLHHLRPAPAPLHVEAAVNLGLVLQLQGRLDAAMAWYGRAWRARPEAFGRIAHALCSEPHGRLWLDLEALREALRAA